MRFEKLLWLVLATFLSGGAGLGGDTLVGALSDYQTTDGTSDISSPGGGGEYHQATDGTTENPPPRP